jgi:hypothetical protein
MNNLSITLNQLSKLAHSFELDFDANGYLRTLTSKNNCPLLTAPLHKGQFINKQRALTSATQLLNTQLIKHLLHTDSFNMKVSEIQSFAFGYRVTFQQMANFGNTAVAVRGGAIHIAINAKGQIFSISSTIQHGQVLPPAKTMISKSKAITSATAKCKEDITSTHAKFMFASHKGEIQPLYEITLQSKFAYLSYTYLVLANTGKIINEFSKKLCYTTKSEIGIKAEALLVTPDPNLTISAQINRTLIKNLPDKQILKDEHFEMFTGAFAKTVSIKNDGTYCYGARDPEFAAVSVFLSLKKQIELYLSLGLGQPKQPMFVVVDDPFLRDNAYFDPQRYEIHIGVGSGVKHRGLTKHIAFDLSVANHEFGHAAVFLQVPGGDLTGKLGEAINEAIGDVIGALAMDYLGRIWYAKELDQSFNANDLENDSRIVGKYALPPFGIRCQKNNKKWPNDLAKESHADGLIIGGALADLLVAIATDGNILEDQIKLFVKMTLMALALLPSYEVTFHDMLRAMITADKEICHSNYRSAIERSFAAHGIVLDTTLQFDQTNLLKKLALAG